MGSKDQPEVGAEARPARQRVKRPTWRLEPGGLVRTGSSPDLPARSQRLVRAYGHFAVLRGSSLQWQSSTLGQRLEHLLQVHIVFGGGLEGGTAVPEDFPNLLPGHDPLIFRKVRFVGTDHYGDAGALFGLEQSGFGRQNFGAQRAHFFKRLAVVQAEHEKEDVACGSEERERVRES